MADIDELPDMEKDLDFATLAIAHRILTREQMEKAQATLDKESAAGKPKRPVEEILLESGVLRSEQVWAVYKARERLMRDARTKGQRIGGYEVVGKLGEGGLGVVYKARQLSMGRIVALKVLHERWVTDDEFRKRFLVEARLVGRLSHQNLIQVFDVGRYRNTLYFSMEFVDGEPVDARLDREGKIPVDESMSLAIQVARALQYLHQRKIVHRDVKPGNIMVTRSGIAKLGDFGFVKSSLESVLSTEGEVLGTPDYISPEAAKGEKNLDYRSDLYSLGATLYHMLAGVPPFGGSVSDVMEQHIKVDPRPLKDIRPEIPPRVSALVERLMDKRPESRTEDFDALLAEMELIRLDAGSGDQPDKEKASLVSVIREGGGIEDLRVRDRQMQKRITTLQYALVGMGGLLLAALAAVAYLLYTRPPVG